MRYGLTHLVMGWHVEGFFANGMPILERYDTWILRGAP